MDSSHTSDQELLDAAGWLSNNSPGVTDSTEFAIGTVVPDRFEAYARVFNPILDETGKPTPWATVADETGTKLTASTSWQTLAAGKTNVGCQPKEGTLEEATARALSTALRGHTDSPERCFFAMWGGYAELDNARSDTIVLPSERRMYIFAGPIEQAHRTIGNSSAWRTPVRWWPAKREWCVGADIYSRSVIIGGTRACIADILASSLEAFEIEDAATVPLSAL